MAASSSAVGRRVRRRQLRDEALERGHQLRGDLGGLDDLDTRHGAQRTHASPVPDPRSAIGPWPRRYPGADAGPLGREPPPPPLVGPARPPRRADPHRRVRGLERRRRRRHHRHRAPGRAVERPALRRHRPRGLLRLHRHPARGPHRHRRPTAASSGPPTCSRPATTEQRPRRGAARRGRAPAEVAHLLRPRARGRRRHRRPHGGHPRGAAGRGPPLPARVGVRHRLRRGRRHRRSTCGRRATRAPPASPACCTPSCHELGIHSASLWAAVPTYVPSAPSPKAALALVQRTCRMLDTTVDNDRAAVRHRRLRAPGRRSSSLEDEETDRLRRPPRGALRRRARQLSVDGESLVDEVERFLRDQD